MGSLIGETFRNGDERQHPLHGDPKEKIAAAMKWSNIPNDCCVS